MNTPQPEPRLFHLVRPSGAADLTGAAGRRRLVTLAEGVEWSDRTVTLRWRGQWPTTSVWEGGIDAVLAVHARNGITELRWLPATPPPPVTAAESTPPPTSTTAEPAPPPTGTAVESAPPPIGSADWLAVSGLRLAAPGVDGRCVSCGLVWPCLSCGP